MNTNYEDKEIVCALCDTNFMWTSGEQSFLNDLKDEGKIQFVVLPKRCPDCRRKKKEEEENNKNFNSGYPSY